MQTLQEMIAAAQKRVDEASDEAEKTKAEAELNALRKVQDAGFSRQSDLNQLATNARSEGKTQGEREARAKTLRDVGIDPDAEDADSQLEQLRELSEGQKSEAERYKSQAETLGTEKEAESKRADEAEARLRDRDRRDAILSALSEENYTGKTGHAVAAIDASFSDKVKENEGKFDASEAVKALKDDEFPGFGPEKKSGPPPAPDEKPGQKNSQVYKAQYSVPGT